MRIELDSCGLSCLILGRSKPCEWDEIAQPEGFMADRRNHEILTI